MTSRPENSLLSIGSVVRRTGITESTLRAWERRYGFPTPQRAPSGHRRYQSSDIDDIRSVVAERDRGADLATAIARVANPVPVQSSFFAQLRRSRPDLAPVRVMAPQMLALSRAIEDESLSRAEPSILLGAFQQERFYRRSERRWRVLGAAATEAIVFADFKRAKAAGKAPVEIPLGTRDPVTREWVLICLAPGHAACVVGWEPPSADGAPERREFELIFALDPSVVREAALVALPIVLAAAPTTGRSLEQALAAMPAPSDSSQLLLSSTITARMLNRLA